MSEVNAEQWLAEENSRLRKAGCELAIAALYVIKEHDGLHRLAKATEAWCRMIADEGGRGEMYNPPESPDS